jgi:hypothetical protein
MKKNIQIALFFSAALTISSCDVVQDAANVILAPESGGSTSSGLTNDEVIRGLKEALSVGINNATGLTSKTDGFLKNADISIPWPEDAMVVKQKAEEWGLSGQVNNIVTTLNRAAEEASKEAAPIFLNAIRGMSISDGFGILRGGEGAATNFLKDRTTAQLKQAFAPKVDEAIQRVELTKYWNPVVTRYNQSTILTGTQQVNPDLNDYVLTKAIDGLFTMVEKEENKIRKDPAARVTDILQKVFGSLGN